MALVVALGGAAALGAGHGQLAAGAAAKAHARWQRRLLPFTLTPRETEIVQWLIQGFSNKEIAGRCAIGEQTVKDHLKHIYSKVGVHQRTALMARLLGSAAQGWASIGRA